MKRFLYLITPLAIGSIGAHEVQVSVKPLWHNLDTNPETIKQFGGKWIHAGSIALKRSDKEKQYLTNLVLKWHGQPLEQLQASLYLQQPNKPLLTIPANHLTDSLWGPKSHKLIFNFDHPLYLDPHTTLCLVLTVPEEHEAIIKAGSLSVESANLPLKLIQQTISWAE